LAPLFDKQNTHFSDQAGAKSGADPETRDLVPHSKNCQSMILNTLTVVENDNGWVISCPSYGHPT